MQTKCPHCQTVFKVSDEHLKVADGYVRCGICKEVFNALEKVPELDLTESAKTISSSTKDEVEANASNNAQADLFGAIVDKDKPEAAASVTTEAKASKPKAKATKPASPVSKTKAESKTASEPPAEKSKETEKSTEQISVSATPASSKTKAENVANTPDTAADNNLFDGVQSKLIPDEYRIPELHNTYSLWQDISWSLAILILTAGLFVEYAWFNRNELISNPQLRPLVTQICLIADCDAMNLREPNAIEMTTRNIYTHPNVDDALMISGTLINHAQFEQPYPSILIDFSDVRGEVIASRIFTPEDYLQIKAGSLKPLAPQASIDFNMEILDPGKQAMTYEFSFL